MRTSFTKRFGSVELVRKLWSDDVGALIATEWVVVATIMVLGIIPGLVAVRQGTLSELTDMANAALSLNQSYSFSGQELVCGNCDRVNDQDAFDGQNGFGGNAPRVSGINNLPKNAVGAKNVGGQGTRDGFGTTDTRHNCRPIARTAGSAFVDNCKSVQTKGTPAQACTTNSSPCE